MSMPRKYLSGYQKRKLGEEKEKKKEKFKKSQPELFPWLQNKSGLFFDVHAGDPIRPTFDDVFTVEVDAVFIPEAVEMAATLYFDRGNNRAAIDLFYQNEDTKKIYLFNDNEVLSISGIQCTVEEITDDPESSVLRFFINQTTNQKILSPPAEFFHFERSTFGEDSSNGFQQLYSYKGKMNIYGQKDCDVTHLFTRPDFSTANCGLRNCSSTLRSIILQCPQTADSPDEDEIYNRFEFFKFRNTIEDDSVFQPHEGIFCARLKNTEKLPKLPKYFSFSYDVFLRQTDIPTIAKGQNVEHHKLWYDGDIKVIRVDKYEENGRMSERKIYDFNNGMMYETSNGIQECEKSSLSKAVSLEEATALPEIIFPWISKETKETPVFIGERMVQGFQYEVWSSEAGIADMKIIREFYFIKKYGEGVDSDNYKLQLAFIQYYDYGNEESLQDLKLQEEKSYSINNFLTSPRDWVEFDVSDCFDEKEKTTFEVEFTGDSIESATLKNLKQAIFLRLLESSKISAVRLGQLQMVYRKKNAIAFTGVIIENLAVSASTAGKVSAKTEPDMTKVFDKLKADVTGGAFFVNITINRKDLGLRATYFGSPRKYAVEASSGEDGYTGGAMGALGVVMVGIGVIVGGVAVYVYSKSRPKSESLIAISS